MCPLSSDELVLESEVLDVEELNLDGEKNGPLSYGSSLGYDLG